MVATFFTGLLAVCRLVGLLTSVFQQRLLLRQEWSGKEL